MTSSNAKSRAKAGDIFKPSSGKRNAGKSKPEPTPQVLVGAHGRYLVKSGRLGGEYVARAFPKPPTKVRGLIAEAKGATEEAAIAALHDIIDSRESRRTDERRMDARSSVPVPSVAEYVEAIGQLELSRPQKAMLTALSLAGEDGLTETRMTRVAGYKSKASAVRSFASGGLLIADYLSIETGPSAVPGDPEGAALLGYRGEAKTADEPGNWILHVELREAVRESIR